MSGKEELERAGTRRKGRFARGKPTEGMTAFSFPTRKTKWYAWVSRISMVGVIKNGGGGRVCYDSRATGEHERI